MAAETAQPSEAARIQALEAAVAMGSDQREILQRHLRAMTNLAKRHVFINESLPEALASITELCSLAIDVQRSSIWLLVRENTALRCLHLHDQRAVAQGAGGELPSEPFPNYFSELLTGRVIDAKNAQTDPRTREFTETYLKPLNIHAMLDAPIRLRGRLVGVVCLEHTSNPRKWIPEDLAFIGFVAHAVSMVLEVHFRRGGSIPDFNTP